jgi:ribonuclease HI
MNVGFDSTEEIVKGKRSVDPPVAVAHPSKSVVAPSTPWKRPSEGFLKLNVDGSFMAADGTAGAGMILRSHDGEIIFSASRSLLQCSSALESEVCALMEGIALAQEHNQQHFVIESDSAEVVQMLNNNARDLSPLGHLVAEVKTLMSSGQIVGISKIPRSQNIASHLLAGFGRSNDRTEVWLGSGPESILGSLLRDCNTPIYD